MEAAAAADAAGNDIYGSGHTYNNTRANATLRDCYTPNRLVA